MTVGGEVEFLINPGLSDMMTFQSMTCCLRMLSSDWSIVRILDSDWSVVHSFSPVWCQYQTCKQIFQTQTVTISWRPRTNRCG